MERANSVHKTATAVPKMAANAGFVVIFITIYLMELVTDALKIAVNVKTASGALLVRTIITYLTGPAPLP
jgi:hypothetical protein